MNHFWSRLLFRISQRSPSFRSHRMISNHRIADLLQSKPVGTKTTVQGWVKSTRKMKTAVFFDLSDGSTAENLQVVVSTDHLTDKLEIGAALEVFGEVKSRKDGNIELGMENVTILGDGNIDEDYPFIAKRTHPPDHIRQYLHLRPRTSAFGSVLRIRDTASRAFRDHFLNEDFIEVNTPVLTSCDCEGAGEVFTVKPNSKDTVRQMMKEGSHPDEAFFNTKAYLTVSGQLHLESCARALGNVYSFGPIFRAENSKSRLHLAEFYMLEAESIFIQSMDDLLRLMERMLRCVTKRILDERVLDIQSVSKIQQMQNKLPGAEVFDVVTAEKIASIFLSEEPYKKMTFQEAVDFLLNINEDFKVKPRHGENLAKEHELCLVKHNNNRPVFIIDWPVEMKPFYMKHGNEKGKVSAVDLLVPIVGELCGGSLREDNLSLLSERMKQNNLHEKMAWYLDLRKYGNVPSGGFGMGFERYLQCILSIYNIKDVIPFPRWPHNCQM